MFLDISTKATSVGVVLFELCKCGSVFDPAYICILISYWLEYSKASFSDWPFFLSINVNLSLLTD